jgi:hypothetical protein
MDKHHPTASMDTTPDYRALCAEQLPELRGMFERILCIARSSGGPTVGNIELADRLIDAVVSWSENLRAQPESDELLPGYIDPEHKGQDRELLEVFYRACRSEGGTADEIHLRGLKAVLALAQPEPEGLIAEQEALEAYNFAHLKSAGLEHSGGMGVNTENHRAGVRAILALCSRPAIEPVPADELLAAYRAGAADAALTQPEPEGQASSDCLMRIAHAKPFVDWEFNIAHIFRRGLQGLPEDDGTQEWMKNAVGICLGAVAEAAQPEPEGPTDEELWDLYQDLGRDFSPTEFARTVLARWGRPAIEPVPVSERPWERGNL